ncbi:hypothetical protein J1N35_000685 [Gossypium stocksii]|uniref:Uncharacterized protein n=1 Tax=Gossypium stocksii TaxID=47602 RepID=A0A9D3WHI8_9ROSI|nr:hypothetical protein J1N35_000685 [Gossypium stocksii]
MGQFLDYLLERAIYRENAFTSARVQEPVPIILEYVEGGSDEKEEDLRFRVYSLPAHIHNVNLSQDDVLEFPDLPHRRRNRISSSLDSGELEVGKEFSNKDSFLGALKQHSTMNGVNYNVVKSKSDKFKAKCAVQDGVVVALVGIVVPPAGDLVLGGKRMTHLDKIMNAEVFASPMAEVFESHRRWGLAKRRAPRRRLV